MSKSKTTKLLPLLGVDQTNLNRFVQIWFDGKMLSITCSLKTGRLAGIWINKASFGGFEEDVVHNTQTEIYTSWK